MNLNRIPARINNRTVTILGAGRSGIAAAKLLATKGARVLLSDAGQPELSSPTIQQLRELNVEIESGAHSRRVFDCDFVVASPGIANDVPIILELEKRRLPLISEVELAYWFSRSALLIGVTGSNGKTTTVSLLHKMFNNNRFQAFCGGNIGTAYSDLILASEAVPTTKTKVFIVEFSSFQLERIIHLRPDTAIILNITEDHMDRYDHNIHNYLRAKLNIAKNQTAGDQYIYNADSELLNNHLPRKPEKIPFGFKQKTGMLYTADNDNIYDREGKFLIARSAIALRGEHNLYNILAALSATAKYHVDSDHLLEVLRNFKGIEHRLEYTATIDGIEFYNDSKGTNVDSVKNALRSFRKPVTVILGGRDKDSNFENLIPEIRQHVKTVITLGEAAPKIEAAIQKNLDTAIFRATSMADAVRLAYRQASSGEVVLLSPACASFDMFPDFEQRGRVFKEAVKSLKTQKDYVH